MILHFTNQNAKNKQQKDNSIQTQKILPTDWKKIDTDASFKDTNSVTRIGAICRDHNGVWIQGVARHVYCTDALEAELKAVKEALSWISQTQWTQ